LKGGAAIRISISIKEKAYISKQEIIHMVLAGLFFIVVVNINSYIISIFDYTGVGTILLAPLNEEFFRFVSFLISGPIVIYYTCVLAFTEFVFYLVTYSGDFSGWGFWAFFIMRVLCILAHFLFFYIQYTYYKISIQRNNKCYLIFGMLVATSAHIIYNNSIAQGLYDLIR